MNGPDVAYLRSEVERFESLVREAMDQKYGGVDKLFIPVTNADRWKLVDFFDAYVVSGVFPRERLKVVTYKLLDLKLQSLFLMEVDIGLYNRLIFDETNGDPNLRGTPLMKLRQLSIDQTVIVKARILWERLMNLVYFMETGKELDDARSAKRSKATIFFTFVGQNPRWFFLAPYRGMLVSFESRFRTPELHKNSVLRAEFMGTSSHEPNDILEPLNQMLNVVWRNLLDIMRGRAPTSFSDLHLGKDGSIDPRYLAPGQEPTFVEFTRPADDGPRRSE